MNITELLMERQRLHQELTEVNSMLAGFKVRMTDEERRNRRENDGHLSRTAYKKAKDKIEAERAQALEKKYRIEKEMHQVKTKIFEMQKFSDDETRETKYGFWDEMLDELRGIRRLLEKMFAEKE